jgi:hypothetical protein
MGCTVEIPIYGSAWRGHGARKALSARLRRQNTQADEVVRAPVKNRHVLHPGGRGKFVFICGKISCNLWTTFLLLLPEEKR